MSVLIKFEDSDECLQLFSRHVLSLSLPRVWASANGRPSVPLAGGGWAGSVARGLALAGESAAGAWRNVCPHVWRRGH